MLFAVYMSKIATNYNYAIASRKIFITQIYSETIAFVEMLMISKKAFAIHVKVAWHVTIFCIQNCKQCERL